VADLPQGSPLPYKLLRITGRREKVYMHCEGGRYEDNSLDPPLSPFTTYVAINRIRTRLIISTAKAEDIFFSVCRSVVMYIHVDDRWEFKWNVFIEREKSSKFRKE